MTQQGTNQVFTRAGSRFRTSELILEFLFSWVNVTRLATVFGLVPGLLADLYC